MIQTDQRHYGGAALFFAWLLALVTLGYLLPFAIAVSRGRSNVGGIFALNLFLG